LPCNGRKENPCHGRKKNHPTEERKNPHDERKKNPCHAGDRDEKEEREEGIILLQGLSSQSHHHRI